MQFLFCQKISNLWHSKLWLIVLISINITQPGAQSWHFSTLPRYLFSSFTLPGFLVSNTQSLTSIPIGHLAPSPFFSLSSFAPWQHLFPSFLSTPLFHKSFHRKKRGRKKPVKDMQREGDEADVSIPLRE